MHGPLPTQSLPAPGKPLPGSLVACPDCDLLQRIPDLPPGGEARCPRCGRMIAMERPDSLDRALALTVAAAIAFVIANVTPLMGLVAVGRHSSTTIFGGVWAMWLQGEKATAALMAFCALIAPAAYIGFMLTVLAAVRRSPAPSWAGACLRIAMFHHPWTMFDVMMLGILVALKKIADLATVVPGIGMYAVGALIVLITAITVSFDPRQVWMRIRWADSRAALSAASAETADAGRSEP